MSGVAGPHTPGMASMLTNARNRPTTSDWVQILGGLPLFKQASKRHLRKVASLAEVEEFSDRDVVVQKGEPGDGFYLILGGRAKLVGRPKSGSLGVGDYFGEMALLDGEPRSATVSAVGELHTMRIPRRPFLRLLEQEPKLAVAMMTELAGRVRRLEKTPAA